MPNRNSLSLEYIDIPITDKQTTTPFMITIIRVGRSSEELTVCRTSLDMRWTKPLER